MSAPDGNPKPDGKAFDDFFDSIGSKAEQVNSSKATDATVATPVEEEQEQKVVDEIESLCMNCHANGITRLLLTRIPFFREIIIMSFNCPHCNFKNSEIQSAGEIQQKGIHCELRLTSLGDFARQVVKSDTCVVKFIELDVEVPAGRGQLSNIEGLLSMVLEDLEVGQKARKEEQPEVHTAIEAILTKGRKMLDGMAFPFRVSLDDPSGNSLIEPDQTDGVGKLLRTEYPRTPEQNEALGLGDGSNDDSAANGAAALAQDDDIIPNEVYSFPATCPGCTKHCTTHMKMVEIPHFKQVVIMSTVCDQCGYRSNEVKTGGEVPEKGKKIILKVNGEIDLARDILKSESCALECPELKLSVNPGTLGGRFTTVEGLLTNIRDDLKHQIFDIGDSGGDSLQTTQQDSWSKFFEGLDAAIKGEVKFTVILSDPLASSYVQNLCSPDDDPQITTEEYDRTEEEEEDLGLKDIKTEGYEEGHAADLKAEQDRKDEEAKGE
ncbi:nucleolar zinc-finger protein [Pseudogymnoascus australis]